MNQTNKRFQIRINIQIQQRRAWQLTQLYRAGIPSVTKASGYMCSKTHTDTHTLLHELNTQAPRGGGLLPRPSCVWQPAGFHPLTLRDEMCSLAPGGPLCSSLWHPDSDSDCRLPSALCCPQWSLQPTYWLTCCIFFFYCESVVLMNTNVEEGEKGRGLRRLAGFSVVSLERSLPQVAIYKQKLKLNSS